MYKALSGRRVAPTGLVCETLSRPPDDPSHETPQRAEEEARAKRRIAQKEEIDQIMASAGEVVAAPAASPLGSWLSEKGQIRIVRDPMCARLCYEEGLKNGDRLYGFLEETDRLPAVEEGPQQGKEANEVLEEGCWQAELRIVEDGKDPWYGPSFGPKPSPVGDVLVRLLRNKGDEQASSSSGHAGPSSSSLSLETRIRVRDDDNYDEDAEVPWEPPVRFKLLKAYR